VDDRDEVAEAAAEAAHRLRREGDLRDEHDRPEPALERRGAGLEVHLCLAAAGRAVQQDVLADPLVERGDDPLDGHALLVRQALGLGLAFERLAQRGRGTLPARRPADGRDELEGARGGRAVVVGEPQREIDERGRNLVQQPADRRRLDPRGRADADVGDDATGRAAPEPDRDDRALDRPLGHLVRERPREGAGGYERVDRRERHAVEGTCAPRRPSARPG
jgi:hypothetical protein